MCPEINSGTILGNAPTETLAKPSKRRICPCPPADAVDKSIHRGHTQIPHDPKDSVKGQSKRFVAVALIFKEDQGVINTPMILNHQTLTELRKGISAPIPNINRTLTHGSPSGALPVPTWRTRLPAGVYPQ